MVLREVAAERLSGLKKRLPVETPILEQIPRPARILSSVEIAFEPGLGIVPIIVRGKAYGEVAGGWYRVTFPRTLNEPSVVCVGEGRTGVIPTPKAPTIAITSVSVGVARTAVGIASAGVPKAANIVIPTARRGHVPTSLGRFSCGWAIASLTDGLNDLVATLESVLVRMNQVVDDLYSGLENARSSLTSLDGKVNDLRDKANAALGTFRTNIEDGVNAGLEALRKNTEGGAGTALDTFRKNTESAVNVGLAAVIPALYNAWGIPTGMAITPVHIRNVTSTGFEFQSYGKTTCYYIGIGSLR